MFNKKTFVLVAILFLLTACSNNKVPTQNDIILEKNLIINDLENKIRSLQSSATRFVSHSDEAPFTEYIIDIDAIVLSASTNSINKTYDSIKGPWALFYTPTFETNQALFFNTESVTTMVLEENQEVILTIKITIDNQEDHPSTVMELISISNP